MKKIYIELWNGEQHETDEANMEKWFRNTHTGNYKLTQKVRDGGTITKLIRAENIKLFYSYENKENK